MFNAKKNPLTTESSNVHQHNTLVYMLFLDLSIELFRKIAIEKSLEKVVLSNITEKEKNNFEHLITILSQIC